MKRRIIGIVISVCLVFGCAACKGKNEEVSYDQGQDLLYDHGIQIIHDIDSLAKSKEYIHMITANDEIKKIITMDIASQDYDKPSKVFAISGIENSVYDKIKEAGGLPKDIRELVRQRFASGMCNQISSSQGTAAMASASMLGLDDTFLDASLKESIAYLYVYEGKSHFIINFTPRGEDIVMAVGNVVIDPEISKLTTVDKVLEYFENAHGYNGIIVKELQR